MSVELEVGHVKCPMPNVKQGEREKKQSLEALLERSRA